MGVELSCSFHDAAAAAARILDACVPTKIPNLEKKKSGAPAPPRSCIALSPQTGELVAEGDVVGQTKQVMENLKAVLEEAGCGLAGVVKTSIFIKSMGDFPKINEVYGSYFASGVAPARATVEVSCLPKNVLVEIDAIAILN